MSITLEDGKRVSDIIQMSDLERGVQTAVAAKYTKQSRYFSELCLNGIEYRLPTKELRFHVENEARARNGYRMLSSKGEVTGGPTSEKVLNEIGSRLGIRISHSSNQKEMKPLEKRCVEEYEVREKSINNVFETCSLKEYLVRDTYWAKMLRSLQYRVLAETDRGHLRLFTTSCDHSDKNLRLVVERDGDTHFHQFRLNLLEDFYGNSPQVYVDWGFWKKACERRSNDTDKRTAFYDFARECMCLDLGIKLIRLYDNGKNTDTQTILRIEHGSN